MRIFLQLAGIVLIGSALLASVLVMVRLKQPTSFINWGIKVFATALAPFFALIGILTIATGMLSQMHWLCLPGLYTLVFFLVYLYRVDRSVKDDSSFKMAYGANWQTQLTDAQRAQFLHRPTAFRLRKAVGLQFTQNIPFYTLPDTGRTLLADLWQPPQGVKRTGLAFIYFHGSAWTVLDKDFGTRPFFEHLVAQGHVVMDVAYRLFPETDMAGMLADVYQAIAWLKRNALAYGIDPHAIVIGGGSAGGHLALLAAYSYRSGKFVPAVLRQENLEVRAVVSAYGPPDLTALYYHTGQHLTQQIPVLPQKEKAEIPAWLKKMMGINFHRLGMDKDVAPGNLTTLLGCRAEACPALYAEFSPVSYVHQACPPTLILQGMHDLITPALAARQLYGRLTEAGVRAVMQLLPQTDHAFDLILPRLSPIAHTAPYSIERFLALQLNVCSITAAG